MVQSPRRPILKRIAQSKELYVLFALPLLYFAVFKYGAISWMGIAFKEYNPVKGYFGSDWVGLKYFRMFMEDPYFWQLIRNTLLINFWLLAFYFPFPIILALMINEVRAARFRRLVQTVSYIPHFFSVVVISGLILNLCATEGIINSVLKAFGMRRIPFLTTPAWFRPIYVISEIWQRGGWASIIYLAALAGIDPQLYEVAVIDGASRMQQTRHISLPGIISVISIQFLLTLGNILSIGYEKILLLYNGSTMSVADVISTYVYRRSIVANDYSYGTAVNVFQAVIGLMFVAGANKAARRLNAASLW